jgi:hypothetical protein
MINMSEKSYQYWNPKKQIIWIWIRHLRFELEQHFKSTNSIGYKNLINNSLSKIENWFETKNYKKIVECSGECMKTIKFINGNHFHIWLFYKLQVLVSGYASF